MRVVVAGGRAWRISERGLERLRVVLDELGASLVVTGGARGIDDDAHRLATMLGYPTHVEPADWAAEGRQAGPSRNARMAAIGDVLIAFPGGSGTRNMIRHMEALGKRVIDWRGERALVVPSGLGSGAAPPLGRAADKGADRSS